MNQTSKIRQKVGEILKNPYLTLCSYSRADIYKDPGKTDLLK